MDRSFLLPVMALILAFGAACGDSDDGEVRGSTTHAMAAASEGSTETTYANGHALSTDSVDPAVLAVEDEILQLCNDHRVALGLNALVDDPGMRKVARAHSLHMIEHDFFEHANPEGDTPGDRLTGGGVIWEVSGENIAAGFPDAAAAFEAWLDSPGHKANIERPDWTHTGPGYWADPADPGTLEYGRYYTQLFLRR